MLQRIPQKYQLKVNWFYHLQIPRYSFLLHRGSSKSKTASTIRVIPINIHKTAVVLKGFVMTVMPQTMEIAALP